MIKLGSYLILGSALAVSLHSVPVHAAGGECEAKRAAAEAACAPGASYSRPACTAAYAAAEAACKEEFGNAASEANKKVMEIAKKKIGELNPPAKPVRPTRPARTQKTDTTSN